MAVFEVLLPDGRAIHFKRFSSDRRGVHTLQLPRPSAVTIKVVAEGTGAAIAGAEIRSELRGCWLLQGSSDEHGLCSFGEDGAATVELWRLGVGDEMELRELR